MILGELSRKVSIAADKPVVLSGLALPRGRPLRPPKDRRDDLVCRFAATFSVRFPCRVSFVRLQPSQKAAKLDARQGVFFLALSLE